MIPFSYFKPRVIPVAGAGEDVEIDRVQTISIAPALNRMKIEEHGRDSAVDGVVGYLKRRPTVAYRMMQYEYGSLEFWRKIACQESKGGDGEDEITLNDFKTSYFDICAYLSDDDGTFVGTQWYPSLRTSGFSLNIGDPQALLERNFEFTGEQVHTFQGTNKYVIFDTHTCTSGDSGDIVLSSKVPVVDPDDASKYMLRVVRVRAGVTTELVLTTDYTYTSGTTTLHINTVATNDVIKYWYTSATAPDTIFSVNNTDVAGILGDSVSIYLYIPASGKPSSTDYIYRLQNVNIDVKFDRDDKGEIGNKDIVQRGVKNSTVTVKLGRILEDFTVEEVLRGAGADYAHIDIDNLSDSVALIVKVFSDNTKETLKYGIKCTNLSPTDINYASNVNEYVSPDVTLEGETFLISADTTVLGI